MGIFRMNGHEWAMNGHIFRVNGQRMGTDSAHEWAMNGHIFRVNGQRMGTDSAVFGPRPRPACCSTLERSGVHFGTRGTRPRV